MQRIIYTFLCLLILLTVSCEKSSINSCPDVIENVNLTDFPMDEFGVNEIEVTEDELLINVTYGGGCENHDFIMIMHNQSQIDGGTSKIKYYL
ncbi:MAG: hypothetical protein CM15mP23_03530 [Cryomorphaceae bacterium]|nr:MAG: hypothetical protein CM15mP23_03530 [Cryomorphaceae bacterium]